MSTHYTWWRCGDGASTETAGWFVLCSARYIDICEGVISHCVRADIPMIKSYGHITVEVCTQKNQRCRGVDDLCKAQYFGVLY